MPDDDLAARRSGPAAGARDGAAGAALEVLTVRYERRRRKAAEAGEAARAAAAQRAERSAAGREAVRELRERLDALREAGSGPDGRPGLLTGETDREHPRTARGPEMPLTPRPCGLAAAPEG